MFVIIQYDFDSMENRDNIFSEIVAVAFTKAIAERWIEDKKQVTKQYKGWNICGCEGPWPKWKIKEVEYVY